ncbi:MAG: HAMP domain-containing histidine kinase [Calditrichae bacterium]|nr:HAMP domain-containing histidine kinase [Calditrichota bacterium]MCB9057130.1 HAMP domain-containing histidine kinase [Calditrichia bacterium]
MKLFLYIKRSSVRTKFIFLTLSIFLLVNISFVIYYPISVYEEEKQQLIDILNNELDNIITNEIDIRILNEDEYILTLLSKLEHVYNLEYLATKYLGTEYYTNEDHYSKQLIKSLPDNTVSYISNKHILSLIIPVKDKTRIGSFDLKIGLNAEKVVYAEEKARLKSFIFVLISAVIIYVLAYFFDKIVYIPFKKLIHISHLLTIGQQTLEERSVYSREFNQIFLNMEIMAKRMAELRRDNKLIPVSIKKSKEKAEEIQKNLDKELETMSNLIIYILELRKEKSKSGIYKNLVNEISIGLGYAFCILFLNQNNKLVYNQSSVKGFTILDEKLNMDLENYLITDQSKIFKEMLKHNPLLQNELPFDDIIKKYNLSGNYALLPISSASQFYGMIIVGNLGESSIIEHKDLEKLMLISNTVALHIENLDSFSNLERSVNQRTAELETTNKLLSDSINEKDNMLKLVSHDLNAPLRNVIGLIESIERKHSDVINEDLNDRLGRIRKNVEKELTTIDEILNSYKYAENIDLLQPVNTALLINNIIDELSFELSKKSVKVTIDEQLPVITSNETVLNHIFLNLIDNACKYMPGKKHGNKIEIQFKKEDEYSTFIIADNGVGIEKDRQDTIFESFKQLQPKTGERSGKGLGLTLVKNMVGKLGGDIVLRSKKGQGTTFFIRFKNSQIYQGR